MYYYVNGTKYHRPFWVWLRFCLKDEIRSFFSKFKFGDIVGVWSDGKDFKAQFRPIDGKLRRNKGHLTSHSDNRR